MFGTAVTLVLTLLVLWGLTKKSGPYVATYQYMNVSVAFQGPQNFQTFAIQLVLHVDHLTIAALLAIEICIFAALGWHQVMGRSEPGAARFHAAVTALMFAASGMVMSWDLAELLGFWFIGGALTYLLLSHRWGVAEPAARARVALALPFLSDVCLLSGIAWLYARYGTQSLDALLPTLHTNPGWTTRSLVVASVLLFVGVAGRLALWPFSAWVTQTAVSAPPAATAMRTDDLGEMGDAWRRMRASSGAVLACALVIGLAASGALAGGVSSRSKIGVALGEATLLVAIAALRVYFGASFGPLRRRRAFDPDRVREPQEARGWPYWLAVAGAAFVVASFITGWPSFLDGTKQPVPPLTAVALWVAVPLIGFAVCAATYLRSKDGALGASAGGGAWLGRGRALLFAGVDRFLVAPTTDIARRLGDWIPAGDGALGRFATTTGQLALGAARVPALPLVIVLAIALAVVFALVAPGVVR